VAQSPASSKPLTESRSTLIQSAETYRASSEEVLRLQREEITRATQKFEELRKLVAAVTYRARAFHFLLFVPRFLELRPAHTSTLEHPLIAWVKK
jgi:hypothetical protein